MDGGRRVSNKKPSLMPDTWVALYRLLAAASWPLHPSTGRKVGVFFADTPEPLSEGVCVLAPPRTDEVWATYGASVSKDEAFTLRVIVGTKVPGTQNRQDPNAVALAALTRLLALCDVVFTELRSPTSGRPAGGFSTTVPGIISWGVDGFTDFDIGAMPEGYGGIAEIAVNFQGRL